EITGPACLTPYVMPNPSTKMPVKSRLIGVFSIVVIVIVIGTAMFSNRESQIIRSPAGRSIKLERYAFQRGSVRYDLPNRPIVGSFSKLLPDGLTRRLKWLRPEVTCFTAPTFRNEPLLSAAFGSRDTSGNWEASGTRLAISDDHGQMFDPVLNYLGNS